MSFGGGGEIDIILDDADTKKMAEVKDENGRKERFYLFYDGESVTGKVGPIFEHCHSLHDYASHQGECDTPQKNRKNRT